MDLLLLLSGIAKKWNNKTYFINNVKNMLEYTKQYFPSELVDSLMTKYEQIYVSIGGKYNEPFVEISRVRTPTNALNQMIPIQSDIFILVLDDFGDKVEINTEKITQRIQDTNNHVVLCDLHLTILQIQEIITTIISLMKKHNWNSEQCIICNFIRFLHPNQHEYQFETNIPTAIYRVLEPKFQSCFYQWFGYHPILYSMVYQYKNFDLTFRLYGLALFSLLRKNFHSNTATHMEFLEADEKMQTSENKKEKKLWEQFTKYAFDFVE